MAVDVNIVYQTVLSILNKEQRGYIPPSEFNKLATQVQLEIFEGYFDYLNQQLNVQQSNTEYANRVKTVQEKLDIFKNIGDCTFNAAVGTNPAYFTLPAPAGENIYQIGTVLYKKNKAVEVVERNELAILNLSDMTLPSEGFPVYLFEQNKIIIYPQTIINQIEATYIEKPLDVNWGFSIGGLGQYVFTQVGVGTSTSVNFELDISEQSNIILRILSYSGIVIRDPQIIQAASLEIQQNESNSRN